MTKENHTPEQLRAEAIRTIEDRFQNHLQIYTDGSKVAREPPTESSTTAGYYVADINILFTGHWRLNPDITIAGAELSAIQKALEWLEQFIETKKNQNEQVKEKAAVILTDSKVSLYLILQRKPSAYIYKIQKIQKLIIKITKNEKWNLSLQWIPSHCNIHGNEIADRIANEAHSLEVDDGYPIETNEINIKVKKTTHQERITEWNTEKQIRALGKIKTKIEPWHHTRHSKRPIDVVLTRFRLNHTRLNKHNQRKNFSNSPN